MRLTGLVALLCLTGSALSSNDFSPLDQPFEKSYSQLQHAPCVTLLYRNGRMGCGTQDRELQSGELIYFDGSLPEKDAFVSVMEDYQLTYSNLQILSAAQGGKLKGILVLNSTNMDSESTGENTFKSPDAQTPQGYGTPSEGLQYGYYSYPWNANGQNLFILDLYAIPMAYVLDSDISDALRQESQSESAESSINAEFNYYMGQQEMDSQQCLAWKDVGTNEWAPKCLPLGGQSIWATAGKPPQPQNGNGNGNNNNANKNNIRKVIMLTAGIDSTSMFHDVAPGANTAASNVLTLLMVAKLLGENLNDESFDSLNKRILLGFFQGETYGFIGSRNFLRDIAYPGFQCLSSPVRSVYHLGENSEYACLNPIRPSLVFSNLGNIAGMISIDQLGHETGDGVLYVQYDKNNDSYGSFLAALMIASSTSTMKVAASSNAAGENGYPYPPTPLTSLLQLSGGNYGGAVLTGYDYAFTNKVPYHSHVDSATLESIHLKSIAGAATILARSVVAAAYDDGSYDSDTAAAYAYELIPELSYQNEALVELADCVYYNGQCNIFNKYVQVEQNNEHSRSGINLGYSPASLGTPPSYYVGVYNFLNSQPFVQVGDSIYGRYDGADYGAKKSDAITMIPSQLESAIHGLLNDYLGRGSSNGDLAKCSNMFDCSNVEYCKNYGEYATCTGGGYCVCKRAHYHVALDEALIPTKNKPTGYFEFDEDDGGISPVYTEPYWSESVGVKVYRDVGWMPGFFTLVAGIATGALSFFSAFVLRVGLKKEKLY